jgi:hypothetical protein
MSIKREINIGTDFVRCISVGEIEIKLLSLLIDMIIGHSVWLYLVFIGVRGWMFMARVKGLRVTGSTAFPFPETIDFMKQNHK